MTNLLYWLPRALSILFIIFISLFALDSFESPQWYIALPMHLIPSLILTIITFTAWKKPKIGGVLFFLSGIVLTIISRTIIGIPAIITGILYYLSK